MLEWQQLLKYIDNYVYTADKEEISIVYNERAPEADRVYQQFVKKAKELKWEFDIALDCIRQMDEESRRLILDHLNYTEHHFGLGMLIRNHYIYSSKKHGYFDADNEASVVFRVILTILHPYYDYRNRLLISVIEDYDFRRIKKLYQKEYGDVIEKKLMDIAKNPGEKNCEEILEELCEELRILCDKVYFKKKIVEVVRNFPQKEFLSEGKNRLALKDAVYDISVLYPLEYRQLMLLLETDLWLGIRNGKIKSVNECKQYIDQNIGFKEEYTDFLAQCFFEAFQEY